MPIPNTPYFGGSFTQPVFKPAVRNILSITQAEQAVITTTFDGTTPGDHGYQTGLIIRLLIPNGFGMVLANQLSGTVTVIDSSSFSVDIDTSFMDPFVIPSRQPGFFATPAQVVPFAEITSSLESAVNNVLPY